MGMEKRGRDPLSISLWVLVAGIFGATFYLQQTEYIESMRWYFVGGVILVLIVDTSIRRIFSRFSIPLRGRTALAVGLLFVVFSETSWTIILFSVGALVVVYGLWMVLRLRLKAS